MTPHSLSCIFACTEFYEVLIFPQQLASLSLLELCKASSGDLGCATASPAEISVLLNSLESSSTSLRFATLQGLLVLKDILSTEDHGTTQTSQLIKRLWVAKFDDDEENAKVADKYVQTCLITIVITIMIMNFI